MSPVPFLRIEHGSPTETELAVLAAVFAALVTVPSSGPGQVTAAVRWLRPERRPAFVSPHSWAA
jgi:hypothetical protein